MNMIQRKCPSCSTVFSINQADPSPLCSVCNQKKHQEILEEEWELIEDDYVFPSFCTHDWVWSGVPRGSVWCKHCDVTYDEKKHGVLMDLSGKG